MQDYPGGCLCGAVRFRLASYFDAGFCHCSRCRKFTGAPVTAWALAPAADFAITAGEPARYESRRFCAACGSSLYRELGDTVSVHLAALDEPGAIEPRIHQCVETQLAWLRMRDYLPFVEGTELTPENERYYMRGPADPAIKRDSAISLREITEGIAPAVLSCDVAGGQRRFVAPNSRSLAQACVAGDAWPRAICADDTVVGFALAAVLKQDELGLPLGGDPEIWRFMIDSRYQGLGFGARSLQLLIDELRAWDGARNIWLSCVPGTGSPCGLYERFGFQYTGVIAEGEVVMRLPLE